MIFSKWTFLLMAYLVTTISSSTAFAGGILGQWTTSCYSEGTHQNFLDIYDFSQNGDYTLVSIRYRTPDCRGDILGMKIERLKYAFQLSPLGIFSLTILYPDASPQTFDPMVEWVTEVSFTSANSIHIKTVGGKKFENGVIVQLTPEEVLNLGEGDLQRWPK